MDTKLVKTISSAQSDGEQFNIPSGKVAQLRMVFSGTNDTGQTADLDDLGSIKVTRSDVQIANISVRQLARMLDIEKGQNLFTSTTASTVKASAMLLFYLPNDAQLEKNALAIRGAQELNFEYIPAPGAGTVFANLTLKVYAEYKAYFESYELRTFTDNQIESGSLSNALYQLNKDNIAKVFVEDPDDVINLVQLETNDRTVLSPVDWDYLESLTLSENQLEVTTFAMIRIPVYSQQNLSSAVNTDTNLYLTTSGGGTFPIVTQSLKIHSQPIRS